MSLQHAILGVLEARPMTGYELVQFFDSSMAWVWSAPQSQIYPRLRAMERDGLILPVVEARVRYSLPARYEDEVLVTVQALDLRRSLLRLGYKVERGGDLLATAETLQMLVDRKSSRPRSFPPSVARSFLGE